MYWVGIFVLGFILSLIFQGIIGLDFLPSTIITCTILVAIGLIRRPL